MGGHIWSVGEGFVVDVKNGVIESRVFGCEWCSEVSFCDVRKISCMLRVSRLKIFELKISYAMEFEVFVDA